MRVDSVVCIVIVLVFNIMGNNGTKHNIKENQISRVTALQGRKEFFLFQIRYRAGLNYHRFDTLTRSEKINRLNITLFYTFCMQLLNLAVYRN